MTNPEKILFKNTLKQLCLTLIEKRMAVVKQAIKNAQQGANSEEKSSAGDKYETGRAMGHLEIDMYNRQLAATVVELSNLQLVDIHSLNKTVASGTFVRCEHISFFIAAGLGKQIKDGEIIFFLSPHAPVAKSLTAKKAGDHFIFNNVQHKIIELF